MRIGILGGTFNPIHNGHLRLASQARRRLGLNKVIFVPANIPPHKLTRDILPAKERYKMVKLAIAGYPCFEASDYEIKSGGTSYSVKTLRAFKKKFGKKAKLFFLTGSDSLQQLASWKDIGRIVKLADFVIASRSGHKIRKFPGIRLISIPTLDISSTDIRRRIKKGSSIKKLLPPAVYNYINKKGLYR